MWDKKYGAAEDYVYGVEPNDFLRENFDAIPKGKVLCLADGEGRNSVFLAKQGYEVTAIDSSLVGLEKAKKLADKNQVRIELLHENLDSYELGKEKWDGVVSIFCHLPEELRKKIHKGVLAGLKSKGVFLLESYRPAQLEYGTGGPPKASLMMSEVILRQELGELNFRHLAEVERNVVEGTGHSGLAATVQLIGVKA